MAQKPLAKRKTTTNSAAESKGLKRLRLAVFVLIGVPLAGLILLYITLSGGVAGVFRELKPKPDPASTKLTSKRDAARAEIDGELDKLEKSLGIAKHTVSTFDNCYEGQNNWKVKEGYAHRCDYRITRFYGVNGNLRQEMITLSQALLQHNWQASNRVENTLRHYINDYDYEMSGLENPYQPNRMPDIARGYSKNGIEVDILYTEKSEPNYFSLEAAQGYGLRGFSYYKDENFVDIRAVHEEITQGNRFVLALSLQKNYFDN